MNQILTAIIVCAAFIFGVCLHKACPEDSEMSAFLVFLCALVMLGIWVGTIFFGGAA